MEVDAPASRGDFQQAIIDHNEADAAAYSKSHGKDKFPVKN